MLNIDQENIMHMLNTIQLACNKGQDAIRIPPGKYNVAPGEKAHITLQNLKRDVGAPFIIDATDVELVCQDYRQTALHILNCKNIVVKGLVIGYHRPCMTQGEVIYISDDGRTLDVLLDDGYPLLDSDVPTSYVYDRKTRKMKKDTPDMYSIGCKYLGNRIYKIQYKESMKLCNVAAGDALGFRTEGPMVTIVDNCEKVIIQNLLVTDGCFAVLEMNGEGNNVYDGVVVTYKEKE